VSVGAPPDFLLCALEDKEPGQGRMVTGPETVVGAFN